MIPAMTTLSRKMHTAWQGIITLGRHVGPMISLMYTTLMARYPANPSVSKIDRTNSAG